jgi:hypothetical protein
MIAKHNRPHQDKKDRLRIKAVKRTKTSQIPSFSVSDDHSGRGRAAAAHTIEKWPVGGYLAA